MPINFDLEEFSNNEIFIETGTFYGDTVNKAINLGFKEIYSIEYDKLRYEECKKKFEQYNNVTIIHGDSTIEIPKLLKKINKPATFWLDAHYNADNGECSDKWCPLKEELESIKEHYIKNHTILIDDMRFMDGKEFVCKGRLRSMPHKEIILKIVKEINNEYELSMLDGIIANDVLCCRIKD